MGLYTKLMAYFGYEPIKQFDWKYIYQLLSTDAFGDCLVEVGFEEAWDNSVQSIYDQRRHLLYIKYDGARGLTPSIRLSGGHMDTAVQCPCFVTTFEKVGN